MAKKVLSWHQGKKTYLCALAAAVAVFLEMLGYIDAELLGLLLPLLGAGGLASLRAGLNK